jgi:hypothetical protein
MPRTIGVLPPDDPIFSGGPHFVFRNDPPEVDVTPAEDDSSVAEHPAEEEPPASS